MATFSNKKVFLKVVLLLVIYLGTGTLYGQKKSKIKIENSNEVRINRAEQPDLTKFIGDVFITHENIKMYCDSAYRHDDKNIIEAFSRVHIIQGDTLHMYGDYLKYSGDKGLAEVRKNVKLQDRSVTLTTQNLDYNLNENVGYYFSGGEIIDSTNVLNSVIGKYFTKDHLFFFKDSVVVESQDYTLYSDTLKYNTESHTAFILGPTRIEGEKETLYSEDGWYNTQTNISQFFKNTRFLSQEYSIKGDSIYLDRQNQIGKLFENIELQDTTNNLIIKGNYLESFKDKQEAMVTDSLVFIQVSDADSLFLHADSLRIEKDTADFKQILAFHHVKFYRNNLQGKCDSLVYSMRDSTIRLFSNPILWAQGNQMTADSITIETHNNEVKYLHFRGSSFLCNKEDSIRYNQIKGKSMLGHVNNNRLFRLDVNGNGETLYFPKDKGELIGVNMAKSSNISIRLKDNQIDKIIFITKPDGNLHPIGTIQPQKLYLKNFIWLEQYRPKSKDDIFIWEDIQPKTDNEKQQME